MSSTNHTANYGLSQFLGTDKPAWLVDYNGDMSAIDTQMKANADSASGAQTTANTADAKADANATAINTLDTQINGASGLASDVTTIQGSVNTITSLIGNGEPTTTDKTIIGAINELHSDVNGITVIKSAHQSKSVTGVDGTKTFQEASTAILAELNSTISAIQDDERLVIEGVDYLGLGGLIPSTATAQYTNNNTISSLNVNSISAGGSQIVITAFRFASDQQGGRIAIAYADGTITGTAYGDSDLLSTASITGANIRYSIYKVVS